MTPLMRKILGLLSVIFLGIFIWIFRQPISGIAVPVFLAILMAYLMFPLVVKWEGRLGRIGALWTVFGILIFLIVGFLLLIPRLIAETKDVLVSLPAYIEQVRQWLHQMDLSLRQAGVPEDFLILLRQRVGLFQQSIETFASRFMDGAIANASRLIWFGIVPFLAFYFLKDREYFLRTILYLIPQTFRKKLRHVSRDVRMAVNQFIRGQLLTAFIVGTLTAIGLTVVGVKYAFLLGALMVICELIPYVGPFIAAIPILFAASMGGLARVIWAGIVVIFVQQAENIYLSPRVMGNSVELHPVYVVLLLLIGGEFFGIWGMVLALPIGLAVRVFIKAYKEEKIRNQSLTQKV